MALSSFVLLLYKRANADVAERNGAVVPLKQQRPGGSLGIVPGVARGIEHLDVFVDHLAIQCHLDEAGIADLLVFLEMWGLKDDLQHLPFAGRAALTFGAMPLSR